MKICPQGVRLDLGTIERRETTQEIPNITRPATPFEPDVEIHSPPASNHTNDSADQELPPPTDDPDEDPPAPDLGPAENDLDWGDHPNDQEDPPADFNEDPPPSVRATLIP